VYYVFCIWRLVEHWFCNYQRKFNNKKLENPVLSWKKITFSPEGIFHYNLLNMVVYHVKFVFRYSVQVFISDSVLSEKHRLAMFIYFRADCHFVCSDWVFKCSFQMVS
jgi:hypothetical protein